MPILRGYFDWWQVVDLGLGEERIRSIGGHTNAAQVRELIEWIEGGPQHRGAGTTARDTVDYQVVFSDWRNHGASA